MLLHRKPSPLDGEFQCSQGLATGICPEPEQSNPQAHIVFLKMHFSILYVIWFWWESPKEEDHLKDQGVDGRLGSKWTLGYWLRGGWNGFT
jgi:hypothetical protein